jgi:dihydroxy-acid dehydratase
MANSMNCSRALGMGLPGNGTLLATSAVFATTVSLGSPADRADILQFDKLAGHGLLPRRSSRRVD